MKLSHKVSIVSTVSNVSGVLSKTKLVDIQSNHFINDLTHSTHLIHNTHLKRAAFTLAEVLITLGIIGVVAAITMPTLIQKYQEHVTVNKVKKFYSMMSQAVLMSINDNGNPNEWNVDNGKNSTTATQFFEYIKPYLKIAKDAGTELGSLGYTEKFKLLNDSEYVNYDTVSTNYYKVILADGSYLWFRTETDYCKTIASGFSDSCAAMFFDINGLKKPNTLGKDVFNFIITSSGVKVGYNPSDCYLDDNGFSCLTYILRNGNMKYPATAPSAE